MLTSAHWTRYARSSSASRSIRSRWANPAIATADSAPPSTAKNADDFVEMMNTMSSGSRQRSDTENSVSITSVTAPPSNDPPPSRIPR